MRGLRDLDYWTRLKCAGISSIQRRSDRYRLIYAWEIAASMVPNPGMKTFLSSGRKEGILFEIPTCNGQTQIKKFKSGSFFVEGAKLFNSLPVWVRDTDVSLPIFKSRLDSLLSLIDDQPKSQGMSPDLTNENGIRSNSIKDWIKFKNLSSWIPLYLSSDPAKLAEDIVD